jgi:hypothetical protein
MIPDHSWRIYWLWWFIITFPVGFLAPEICALVAGQPQNTLSASVWTLENLVPGQGISQWNAAHFLFTGTFIFLTLWLIGHFGWGLWR